MQPGKRRLISTLMTASLLAAHPSATVRAVGDEPPADPTFDVPAGTYTGAVYFDGTRTSSGLSAVGQQTDSVQQVDGASIGLQIEMGSGPRSGKVDTGTATVAINWSESGTFVRRTVSETGTLQVSGDVVRLVLAGTLDRALSATDSEGNVLKQQSRTTQIDVTWVLDLVELTCGLFEYRLSEDSKGDSLLWYAQRPRQEIGTAGFEIEHDLTVRPVVKAPGGPDFTNLAIALQQTQEVIEQVIVDPSEQNVELLLQELAALEALHSQFVAAGTCVTMAQATFLATGASLLQDLISQMIVKVLEQDDVPLDVLIDVLGIGVRTGAISPGSGGTGQDVFDAVGAELGEQLGMAIATDDVDTIIDIYVVAVQYGFEALVVTAGEALDQDGSDP